MTTPCPFCITEPEAPCAECGRRGVVEPMPKAPLGWVYEDARAPYWRALAEDIRNPCPEDRPG